MKQKTVRFYEDAPDDMSALKILNDCRKYGFNSAREMVIAAVIRYAQGDRSDSLGLSSTEIDELATKVAMKMRAMNVTIRNEDGPKEEITYENGTSNNDNYQKAISFMDSL